MKSSKRPGTITENMVRAMKLLLERPVRGTEDCRSYGFTYAALTGLANRGLAFHTPARGYELTTEGKKLTLEIIEGENRDPA